MEKSELELIGKIHRIFRERKLRLAVAESCTGGYIGHMITSLPGASEFFDASVVSYSGRAKENILGIGKYMLEKHGAISEETALGMAESVRSMAGADISLSVTGNLGPEPIEGKKTGLIFMAAAFGTGTESKGMMFDGSRDEIKKAASVSALEFLYEVVSVWT